MLDKVGGAKQIYQQPVKEPQQKTELVKEVQPEGMAVKTQPSKEEMEKVVKGMNDFLKPSNTHLKFEFHDELEEYFVTIVDDVTYEVVKEIPSKKLLDMYAAMTDFLGILVDKKI